MDYYAVYAIEKKKNSKQRAKKKIRNLKTERTMPRVQCARLCTDGKQRIENKNKENRSGQCAT